MGFKIIDNKLLKYKEENGVTEVVIPDSVTSIGYGAFANCSSLTITAKAGSRAAKCAHKEKIKLIEI